SVERPFAFPAVEAGMLSAGEHGPDDIMTVNIHTAGSESLAGRFGIIKRNLVDFGQRGLGRVRSGNETNERSRHPKRGPPDRAVDRTRRHTIERSIDALILCRIDWCFDVDIGISLSVAVGVEDERRPTLGFGLVFGFQIDLRIEPAFHYTATGEPQRVVVIEVQVMCTEARIDRRDLLRFGIVKLNLTTA